MLCQARLSHPKADIGRSLAQVLATSSIVAKETLKRPNIYAAQTLGFCRVHDGVGEGSTITMFLFMLLQVSQILLESKPFLRPGATASQQQFSTTADDSIVVELHIGGSQRTKEELVCPQRLRNTRIPWIKHTPCPFWVELALLKTGEPLAQVYHIKSGC